MRLVTIEEHVLNPAVAQASAAARLNVPIYLQSRTGTPSG
jgi:hypothetical protein